MFRIHVGFVMIWMFIGMLFTGCQQNQELGTGTVVGNEKKVTMQEETRLLELSEDERKIYNQYKENKDESCFKQVDPIVMAKLYLHAVLTKDQEMEQALSVHKKPGDHEKLLKKVHSMKRILTDVKTVKFIQENEKSGYLEYPLLGEDVSRFQMVKSEQGIWKVDTSSLIHSS